MRRVLAVALLVICIFQSSGVAVAGPAGADRHAPPLTGDIQLAFTQIIKSAGVTQIGALLTGQGALWAAMHAPAPVFPRSAIRTPRLVDAKRQFFQPQIHSGAHLYAPLLQRPISLAAVPRQPFAIKIVGAGSNVRRLSSGLATPQPSSTMAPMVGAGEPTMTVTPSSVSGVAGGTATVTVRCKNSSGILTSCTGLTGSTQNPSVATATIGTIVSSGTTSTVSFVGAGTTRITYSWSNIGVDLTVTVTAPAPTPTPAPTACPAGWSGTPPNCVAPTPAPTPSPCPAGYTGTAPNCIAPSPTPSPSPAPTAAAASTTGVNPWWTYEEEPIAGVGKYMVNVGTGNLLVQADDISIPERGIDLAFRRTYNSQSMHDAVNTDGSVRSNFGNGWTNTFDAHLGYNVSTGLMSVYDIDGARYDYAPNGTNVWTRPPGQFATLTRVDACHFQWQKKNGTTYVFYPTDFDAQGCGNAAYDGRLGQIFERNSNNSITLNYSFDASGNPSTINVAHANGQQLTLTFAYFGANAELWKITRPDAQTLIYSYDTAGNLTEVDRPGNNVATSLPETYNYANGQLASVGGPRYVLSYRTTGGSPTEGNTTNFSYQGSNLYQAYDYGVVNFTPDDGTSSQLQSSATGLQTWHTNTFAYNNGDAVCGVGASPCTTLRDSDGHATNWTLDASASRVIQTAEWSGAQYLVTKTTWDSNNLVIETLDARGNATDYAFDANGNTIAVAAPLVSVNGVGTFRPTSLYSYDSHNNLVSYCDPVKVGSAGYDWTSRPQINQCNVGVGATGATQFTWDTSDVNEAFGRLGGTYTPLGYHLSYLYDTASQGGDFGLPTSVKGDVNGSCIIQVDNTSRCPTQSFTYDPNGNLVTYGNGVGTWHLSYDTQNNQLLVATDADNVSSYKCYYADGQVQYTETAAQHAADGALSSCQSAVPSNAVAYSYDADGDEISQTHHFGDTAGTTRKWYDAAGRLVEVQQPHDPRAYTSGAPYDLFTYAWGTRYIYDLSQNQTVNVDGAPFHAYGNLYQTQEYGPSNPIVSANITPAAPTWFEVRGSSFDALDRTVASYEDAYGTMPKATNTYDTNGNYGLLSQVQDAVGEQKTLSYYATGWLNQAVYSNDGGVTPAETYSYDANGRATSITSSTFGAEAKYYDADGRLTRDVEPSGGGIQSPADLQYVYYPDGKRQSLTIASALINATNAVQYSYRGDGLLQQEQASYPGTATFSWTYTDAGRTLTQSDPYTGDSITLYDAQSNPRGSRTLVKKQFSYDSYGRIAGLTLPEGYTYGTFTYDDEDEMTQYGVSGAYCGSIACTSTPSETFTYSVRGELLRQSQQATTAGSVAANGFLCGNGSLNQTPGTCTASFDIRTSMVLGQCGAPYSYDTAGREVVSQSATPPAGLTGGGNQTRGYDAENHLISENNTSATGNFFSPTPDCKIGTQGVGPANGYTYGWGPNGHVATLGIPSSSGVTSVHWDGDSILFTVSVNGTLTDYKLGKLARTGLLAGFTVQDRDPSGQEVATHTGVGFSTWSILPAAHPLSKGDDVVGAQPSDPNYGQGVTAFGQWGDARNDGYSNGPDIIQGVRAFDSSMGQWTSPDAYAGEVHDPMSQKPFMWNRNNPLAYEDPSGYCAIAPTFPGLACALGQAARALTSSAEVAGRGVGPGLALSFAAEPLKLADGTMHGIPERAYGTRNFVDNHNGSPPPNQRGGRDYRNDDEKLPVGRYKEYDVNPRGANGRDDQRMVKNLDTGKWYYTGDHYQTFQDMETGQPVTPSSPTSATPTNSKPQ